MLARISADAILLLHLAFIVFVMLGGLLVLHWPNLMLLHVPAIAWAAFVELTGTICPLTFIENRLRLAAGGSGYGGDFVEHYLMPVLYPTALTRPAQLMLALLVIVVNVAMYAPLLRSRRGASRMDDDEPDTRLACDVARSDGRGTGAVVVRSQTV